MEENFNMLKMLSDDLPIWKESDLESSCLEAVKTSVKQSKLQFNNEKCWSPAMGICTVYFSQTFNFTTNRAVIKARYKLIVLCKALYFFICLKSD